MNSPDTCWDKVLLRKDLIGGDIENIEGGVLYRGPLNEIKAVDDQIIFISAWCAEYHNDQWIKNGNNCLIIDKCIEPYPVGRGRIQFSIPNIGICTIYPKGDNTLLNERNCI